MLSKDLAVVSALVLGMAWGWPGSGPRLQAAPVHTQLAAATQAVAFDDVLKLWGAGKKEEALRKFMDVDFARRPLFPKGATLGYSEAEYVALPRAEIDRIQPQLIEGVRPMKALALHVKESADAANQRGDKAQAGQYLGQLERCGQALAHPDSLALLKAVGKAITRMASTARSASTPSASK